MTDRPPTGRSDEARLADHAAIERLADELLPALVARLGATGLGELVVREDEWRVRLRRPASERRLPTGGRGAPGRGGRSDDGRSGELPRGDGAARDRTGAAAHERSGAGSRGPASTDDPPARSGTGESLPPLTSVLMEAADIAAHGQIVATSPAVGIYRARTDGRMGAAVRAGDRLGTVDMLGVPQDVVAPADGIVSAALVEDGDAVEYGQVLLALEPLPSSGERGGSGDKGGSGDRSPERGGGAS
jgi:biotin carboxyl carrier protein